MCRRASDETARSWGATAPLGIPPVVAQARGLPMSDCVRVDALAASRKSSVPEKTTRRASRSSSGVPVG
ncbi:hypothetical protein [Fischerella sp. JS2]|uniref:hypothetical protein n=1 Tax=Fischerella sp. JS2 TaxID=2597771 RepID=UPI0028F0882E|nr:hypothetical protein [Fischerella sp. JS2]